MKPKWTKNELYMIYSIQIHTHENEFWIWIRIEHIHISTFEMSSSLSPSPLPPPPSLSTSPPEDTPTTASRKRHYYCPLGENGPHQVTFSGSYRVTERLVKKHRASGDSRPLEVDDRLCNAHRQKVSAPKKAQKVSVPSPQQHKFIAEMVHQIHIVTSEWTSSLLTIRQPIEFLIPSPSSELWFF